MRKYRMYTGRYGGEVTIGKITEEFLEYSKENDLDEIVCDMGWGEEDEKAWPNVTEEFEDPAWHDVDECLHISGPYADNKYTVTEIFEDGEEKDIGTFDYNHFFSRECYMDENQLPDDEESVPVMTCFSEEKGGFGDVILEIDGDFDPELFATTVVETYFAEIVESYYYDGKELEVDWDWADTIGKAFYAGTGYKSKYFDYLHSEETQKWLTDAVKDHYEIVYEEKQAKS